MLINNHLKKILSIAIGLTLAGCGQVTFPAGLHQAKAPPLLCEDQTQMNITTHLTFDNQNDKTLVGQDSQSKETFPLLPGKTVTVNKEETIAYSEFPAKGKPLTYSYLFHKISDGKSFGATAVTFSMLLPKGVDLSTLNGTRFFSPRTAVGEIACVITQRCPTTLIDCKATFYNPEYFTLHPLKARQ